VTAGPGRGTSSMTMRVASCKDCQRDLERLQKKIDAAKKAGDGAAARKYAKELAQKQASTFSYSEFAASSVLDRGGSRSDRCLEHRRKHRTNIQGMAVAYLDVETLGVALGADSPKGPTGPFGGLGPLPGNHAREPRSANLAEFEFGMDDCDIVKMLEILRTKRVLVLRAGTGTGKSTFGPFRLMDPPTTADLDRLGIRPKVKAELAKMGMVLPDEGPFRLTNLGPIIVTEPRVAAATSVSQFVGERLAMGCTLKQCSNPAHGTFNPKAHPEDEGGVRGPSCPDIDHKDATQRCSRIHVGRHPGGPEDAPIPKSCEVSDCSSHIGPGFPVGYHAKGVRNWDDACQLVYATDGAVINWLRDGRLSRIGTVIVDEAHERSVNIDFIMGYLKRDLAKYPHLRVIITSATFDPNFYHEYFGANVAEVMEVPAVKTVGYGMPLFPELDAKTDDMKKHLDEGGVWQEQGQWRLIDRPEDENLRAGRFINDHWPPTQERGGEVHTNDLGVPIAKAPPLKENEVLEPNDIGTREDLHATTLKLLTLRFDGNKVVSRDQWKDRMPDLLADFVIQLTRGLHEAGIFGDILGFLPTSRTITEACDKIRNAVGDRADVCPLLSSLKQDEIDRALNPRKKGDRRKIVISTNLAETSLTVEGVRFVVDSGLIAQSEWNPYLATGRVAATDHSRSGIKQRWGRVGRKVPGWVFPLYTKAQFAQLAADTRPGSTTENLEGLMMTARMGGVDDVKSFPWPAAFEPTVTTLDQPAKDARKAFILERDRADVALRQNGAVDTDGHPTSFGKELIRFSGLGSTASAMAVMYADRLSCVPEVLTILALLEETPDNRARLVGPGCLLPYEYSWPDEWRVEAANRHRGLASLAEDDAHLALLVASMWERKDDTDPWVPSNKRRAWARSWWVSDEALLACAVRRKAVLDILSPGMKKAVKRPVELALLDRARGVLGRTMQSHEFRRAGGEYLPVMVIPTVEGDPVREPTRFAVESDSVMKQRPERVLALRRRDSRNDDCLISNLIALPNGIARATASRPASSVKDAMAMVIEFKQQVEPKVLRNVALTLAGDWPVGQRLKLSKVDLESPGRELETRPAFPRPPTDEEAAAEGFKPGRRKSRRKQPLGLDEEEDASRADASRELPARVSGIDEERIAAAAVHAVGAAIGHVACGNCKDCLAGRPGNCHLVLEENISGKDVLQSWNAKQQDIKRTVSVVQFAFPDGAPDDEPSWFEVMEYTDGHSTQPTVVLQPDWRDEGADPDPAKHTGIEPGQAVPVRVGPIVKDHVAELRTFIRTDGRGRFLLREANPSLRTQLDRGEIAVSLSTGYQGLLASLTLGQVLTATVVPGRADECFTITLLELLHQHLKKANSVTRIDPLDPKATPQRLYPAEVLGKPNEHGWMNVQLLLRDSERGISHGFSVRAPKEKNASTAPKTTEIGTTPATSRQVPVGSCELQWRRAKSRLDVGELPRSAIEEIVLESARGIFFVEARNRTPGSDELAAVEEELVEPATSDSDQETLLPSGAQIECAQGRPLLRATARDLAQLDESPQWQNEVWAFWARSHHLEVVPQSLRVAEPSEPQESPLSEFELVEETGEELRGQLLEEFLSSVRLGDSCTGVVTTLSAGEAFIDVWKGLEAYLPVGDIAWSRTGHPADVLYVGQEVTVQLRAAPDAKNRSPRVSRKILLPKPFPAFKLAHEVGSPVIGHVEYLYPKSVKVRLENDVKGSIYIGDLSSERIAHPSDVVEVGDRIEVRVIGFNEERQQVNLQLIARLEVQDGGLAPIATVSEIADRPEAVDPSRALSGPPSPDDELVDLLAQNKPTAGLNTEFEPGRTHHQASRDHKVHRKAA